MKPELRTRRETWVAGRPPARMASTPISSSMMLSRILKASSMEETENRKAPVTGSAGGKENRLPDSSP